MHNAINEVLSFSNTRYFHTFWKSTKRSYGHENSVETIRLKFEIRNFQQRVGISLALRRVDFRILQPKKVKRRKKFSNIFITRMRAIYVEKFFYKCSFCMSVYTLLLFNGRAFERVLAILKNTPPPGRLYHERVKLNQGDRGVAKTGLLKYKRSLERTGELQAACFKYCTRDER